MHTFPQYVCTHKDNVFTGFFNFASQKDFIQDCVYLWKVVDRQMGQQNPPDCLKMAHFVK